MTIISNIESGPPTAAMTATLASRRRRTRLPSVSIAVVAGVLWMILSLAACGGDDDSGGAEGGEELDEVTLRLDYTPAGHHVPFFYGREEGYYADEGIELDIRPGKGSGATAVSVGSGEDDFGWMSLALVPITEGAPIQAVGAFIRRSAFGLLVPEDSGIDSFQDLSGKTVNANRSATEYPLLLAALEREGVEDVNINNTGVNSEAIYSGGQGDGVGTVSWYAEPFVDPKRASTALEFWDVGITVMDYGIVANDELIASDPDLVERFMAATVQSWDEAEANPESAIAAFREANPAVTEEVAAAQFEGALDHADTPSTAGKPTGFMSEQDWRKQLEVEETYLDCTTCDDPADYYTNEFLPQ